MQVLSSGLPVVVQQSHMASLETGTAHTVRRFLRSLQFNAGQQSFVELWYKIA